MWTSLSFTPRATRRFGQPVPEHLTVIFAPLGARTVRREICAPLVVSTPLTRTSGNGRIRFAALFGAAAAGACTCSVGSGCATGWTGAGAGGSTTGGVGGTVGTGVGTGVGAGAGVFGGAGAGFATAAVAADIFHTRSRG